MLQEHSDPPPLSRKTARIPVLAPLALAAWLLLHFALPGLFAPEAVRVLQEQAEEKWKAEEAAWEAEMAEYEAYSDAWEQYLVQFQDELDAYDDSWQASQEQYRQALQDYEDAKAIRQEAWDRAFASAEEDLLRAGIRFTVSAERQTESGPAGSAVWRDTLTVNGQKIREQPEMVLSFGETLEFRSEVAEEGDSSRSGSTTGTLSLTARDLFVKDFTFQHRVRVPGPQGEVVFLCSYRFEPEPYTVQVDESALPALPEEPTQPEYDPPQPDREAPGEAPVPPARPEPVSLDSGSASFRETVYQAVPMARILDLGSGLAAAAVAIWSLWRFLRRSRKTDTSPDQPS